MIKPILEELERAELEFTFSEELDSSFYGKIMKVSYTDNDSLEICDKIQTIIIFAAKVLKIQSLVINHTISVLTLPELQKIKETVSALSMSVLFLDYIDESEVVIMNNLYIDHEYGAYKVVNNEMI